MNSIYQKILFVKQYIEREERYNEAIQKVQKMGLVDYDTFMLKLDDAGFRDEFVEHTVFNPLTEEYEDLK